MELHVSIKAGKLSLESGNLPFARRHALRFQCFLLLAYARREQGNGGGWVTLRDIQRLPLWRGLGEAHVGTNVGRYVGALRAKGIDLIEWKKLWRGPYRLTLDSADISFDVPLAAVAKRLGLSRGEERVERQRLLRFVELYSKVATLLLKGALNMKKNMRGARPEIFALASDESMPPDLRLLAHLTAVKILDRLGSLKAVADTLDDCESLMREVDDPAIRARFYLAKSLNYYRAGKYDRSREFIVQAGGLLGEFADSALSGMIADRKGLLISINEPTGATDGGSTRREQKLDLLLQGLWSRLLTENYDAVQASCFNIGNTLYQMGEPPWEEAARWIRLSAGICKSMQVGRYEAIAEIMLAKIAYESGKYRSFRKWMAEAERIVDHSDNLLDRFRCYGLRALDCQRQGRTSEARDYLARARKIYFKRPEFNWKYWDSYFERNFPKIWPDVAEGSKPTKPVNGGVQRRPARSSTLS